MTKAVIVFSGYNPRAVFAFLRTLEKSGVKYAIIASSDNDSILRTTYKKHVLAVRRRIHLDRTDIGTCLDAVRSSLVADTYMIAPSTEALNRWMLRHDQWLHKKQCEIPLVSLELYEEVSNKEAFSNLCKAEGVRVPENIMNLEGASVPLVAKPRAYIEHGGVALAPELLFTQEDLQRFSGDRAVKDYYFQEFIEGSSYYLLFYFDQRGHVTAFSQQNFIQQAGGKSVLAARPAIIHQEEISSHYKSLLQKVGFRGLVMIEVKKRDGEFYMIEANPRFWGPSQLFVDAGINFFELLLLDYNVINSVGNQNINWDVRYFWADGFTSVKGGVRKATYYDYSPELLYNELPLWLAHDVYNREDTKQLFEGKVMHESPE